MSWRPVRYDIEWALGISPGEPACVIRLLWKVGVEPAAMSTTYIARQNAGPFLPLDQDLPPDGPLPDLLLSVLLLRPATAAGVNGPTNATPGAGCAPAPCM